MFDKEYYQQNKDTIIGKQREYRKRKKEKALDLYGRACLLCGYLRVERLLWHDKSGEGHRGRPGYIEALKDPDKFVLLCRVCHAGVHWCMKYLGMKWDEIMVRLPLKGNDNG